LDPPDSAVALYATSPRQIPALLAHCETRGWVPTTISDAPDALAALVRLGTIRVVVAMTWHRHLAGAVSAAGGRLEVVRNHASSAAPVGGLAEQLAALLAAGRLSHGEVSALLAAAGEAAPSTPSAPDPVRRPRRIA
jgi:hypothetical protein